MVENHKVLGDLRGPKKQTREFETLLEREANKSIESEDDIVLDGQEFTGVKSPSANFNSLFLPWHVSAHFAFERVTIRHLLDWALFLVKDGKNIDIELFQEAKKRFTYGFAKFADVLTALSIGVLSMPTEGIPQQIIDDAVLCDKQLVRKVQDYIFEGKSKERDKNLWKGRWNNVRRVWTERWKYKDLYGMGVVRFLFYKGMGVFVKDDEDE